MRDKPKPLEIELRPDGEERFLRAIHAAAKHGPMHRPAKKTRSSQKPRRGGKRGAKA